MRPDLPQTICMAMVWTYWSCVAILVVRSRLRFRTSAGGMPRTGAERRMWLLWAPTVLLWNILPATRSSHLFLTPWPAVAASPLAVPVRWAAAGCAALAFAGTVPCWLRMGANWSMAIVPRKTAQLITGGMFAAVRHPIYAWSMLLMAATVAAFPSPAMAAVACVHVCMLVLKALGEERFLLQLHGQVYADYCRRTGRFFPRITLGRDTSSLRPAA